MNLLPDIIRYIESEFPAEEQALATLLIQSAVLHDGSIADPRCQRAALVGSRGSMEQLKYLVELLKIDYRDVIMSGEYEGHGNDVRRVRDLNVSLLPAVPKNSFKADGPVNSNISRSKI